MGVRRCHEPFLTAAATQETLGYGVLSGIDNRHGYGGYEFAEELLGTAAKYHVRHRFYIADLGHWQSKTLWATSME